MCPQSVETSTRGGTRVNVKEELQVKWSLVKGKGLVVFAGIKCQGVTLEGFQSQSRSIEAKEPNSSASRSSIRQKKWGRRRFNEIGTTE